VPSTARTLSLLVVAIAGCSLRSASEGQAASELRSEPATVAPLVPSRADVEAPDGMIDAAFVDRFLVSPKVAERYARSYAVRKGYLAGEPLVCLALPRADAQGNPVSTQLILGQPGPCHPFAVLLEAARSFWESSRPLAAEPPTTAELGAALQRSGQRFFTVEVAAHAFHHPLHEAQRGLPSWVLLAARDGLVDPRRCSPESLLPPEPSRGHFELVKYRCGASAPVMSHHQRRPVAPAELAAAADATSPTSAFRRWRQVMRAKYGDLVQGRLLKLSELWSP